VNNRFAPDREFPACGYGLSGLCCSACLLGTCRISPFDRDTDRGKCGASADQLVAGNLLRMIAAETAGRLAELTQCVHRIKTPGAEPSAASGPDPKIVHEILEKYGLDRAAAETAGGAGLLANMAAGLLSGNPSEHDLGAVWSRLYPEDIFPQFYSGRLLPADPLALTGLAVFQRFPFFDAGLKDILPACLKVALVSMICGELNRDLEILRGQAAALDIGKNGLSAAETLDPARPLRGLILMRAAGQMADGLERKTETFRSQWPGPLIEIPGPAGLFAVSRQFYRRWSRPPTDKGPPAVVFTASAALVVGILACGYTTVSWPGLPFLGSEAVRRFFTEDLRKICGAVYLVPEAGDILSAAQNYFGKRP